MSSSLNLFFLHYVELGGVFKVGWGFPPNAVNAALPVGPRDTGSVGTTFPGGVCVCDGERREEAGIERCKSWGSGKNLYK